ncbi:DUF72 domain-containing protein [Hymenobacter lucidus]|uniref:DUF72 domain-containing protein n=1 Tax=Hymenobacter lucidus TaxID=2880930 RepID=A0ABS8AUB0_9BACT|nr:DUF72 domain-containing protein [Hymenobacter lucidus]MCB2409790.1 DUF72 domain-containing protein [Hymenobacter lucidus]
MNFWYIGCSGFHYRHWRGAFYPEKLPQRRWFEFYSQHFNTLELNVTFYRFPQLSFVENWYAISPADFCFSVKAPRLITHYKQFNDCAPLLADFYGTLREGLREKLGPVLFQLPPRTAYSQERLHRIVESLEPGFTNVVEFRHPSWWHEEVFQELSRHRISFCGQSHPALPPAVIANTPVLYYRLHGVPELYKSPYAEAELEQLADSIAQESGVQQAFIYFNNDIDASAIRNGLQLRGYLRVGPQ